MTLRGRIEAAFGRWGYWIIRWRWPAVLATLGLTLGLGAYLPQLRVDNSGEAMLRADDPARLLYNEFRDQFGRDESVIIILEPPEVFDFAFLEKLRAFHAAIEAEVPYVEKVTSLINARNTRGEGDELIVEDLLERWPRSEADLRALRERVLANPLYTNILISEDARFTTISVDALTYSTLTPEEDVLAGFAEEGRAAAGEPEFLTFEETYALVEKLVEVDARFSSEETRTYLVGGPIFEHGLADTMQSDISVFLWLSIMMIIGLLALLFRRASGVFLPVLVVLTSSISSFGIMALLDIPYSVTLNFLPAFLIVVGVCDSVHVLAIVYQQLAKGRSKSEAISIALAHSGLAVVMTSITTACGLMSFSIAEIAPVRHLGVVAPIGVMMALLYSLILLPALLAIFPLRSKAGRSSLLQRRVIDRFLVGVGGLATRHPTRVLVATGLILVLGLGGLLKVRFSHNDLLWWPEGDPLRVAAELLDRELKGASTMEVLIHTGRENGLYDPELLNRIERAMRRTETLQVGDLAVNKAVSITDVLKETHQALNENRREFYSIPQDRRLVAQELLLFENSGSDDLEDLTNSQFETARVSVRTPWVDAVLYPDFVAEAVTAMREILGPDVEFDITGGVVLVMQIFNALIHTMARSYVVALAVITPLMIILIGSLRRGLAAMIPNLIPIYLVLGLMGWMDIPLDASTLLIGSVIIGLAVDDTIHFMHKFNRYYEECGDPEQAVRETLATTGSALLFTSLVIAFGFGVFLAAYLEVTYWFGLLASFATVVAFLADVLVAPALMVLITRRRSEGTGLPAAEAPRASVAV